MYICYFQALCSMMLNMMVRCGTNDVYCKLGCIRYDVIPCLKVTHTCKFCRKTMWWVWCCCLFAVIFSSLVVLSHGYPGMTPELLRWKINEYNILLLYQVLFYVDCLYYFSCSDILRSRRWKRFTYNVNGQMMRLRGWWWWRWWRDGNAEERRWKRKQRMKVWWKWMTSL